MSCTEHDWLFSTPCPVCSPSKGLKAYLLSKSPNKYPEDAVDSAEQRKAEYTADEEKAK